MPSKTTPIEPGSSIEPGTWERVVAQNPDHARNYAQRFRLMAEQGADLLGEARFVDAMAPRQAHILDAGCGPGRHASELHRLGHRVVGVDLDQTLIDIANAEAAGPQYLQGNLHTLDLPAQGIAEPFDVILCAGNVISFPAPSSRRPILSRFADHLAPTGRAVIGFGAGRGYEFDDFFADAQASGLVLDLALATWDLKPFTADATFLVATFTKA